MTAGLLIFSYLLGSIPNGLIFGKLIWHKDLRQFGSKNIGATNAWRVIGAKAGILIFLLDFLKGALSVGLAKNLIGDEWIMVGAGFLAVLGHTFSIFLKLRGGKGVATGLGVISVMMPQVTAIVFATWLIIFVVSRYVALASIIAVALTPILAFEFDEPIAFIMFGMLAALFIIIRHKENIVRLIHGKENRFKS